MEETKEATTTINPQAAADVAKYEDQIAALKAENESYATVANIVANNPELRNQFVKVYSDLSGESNTPETPKEPETPKTPEVPKDEALDKMEQRLNKVEQTAVSGDKRTRGEVIEDFEKEWKIDGVDPEKEKTMRAAIAEKLNFWGKPITEVPVDQLGAYLNDAYKSTFSDEIAKEARESAAGSVRENNYGSFGSLGSANVSGAGEEAFTPNQSTLLAKLGVDPEKAKKYYGDRDNESSRLTPSELKK